MVQIRIPGLDHSLSTDGEWLPDDSFHRRNYDYRYPKNLATKRKAERLSEQTGSYLPIGPHVAPRGMEFGVGKAPP